MPSFFEANLGLEQLKTISPVREYDSLQYPARCLNDLLDYALENPGADFVLAANRWLDLQRSAT